MNKCDVLAVMDDAISTVMPTSPEALEWSAKLRHARAAVENLMESAYEALQATPGADQVNANNRLMKALSMAGVAV